jgi:hypothetical protein
MPMVGSPTTFGVGSCDLNGRVLSDKEHGFRPAAAGKHFGKLVLRPG